MTFAEKLRMLRDQVGMSEATLAREAEIPFGTIRSYAMGVRKPSFTAVVRIAEALGTDCRAFAECSDIARPKKRRKK